MVSSKCAKSLPFFTPDVKPGFRFAQQLLINLRPVLAGLGVPFCTALYRFVPSLALSVPFLYRWVPFFVFFFFNYPHLKAIMAHVYRSVPLGTGFSIAIKTLSVISGICGELIAPTYLARICAIGAKMGNFISA